MIGQMFDPRLHQSPYPNHQLLSKLLEQFHYIQQHR